MPKKIILPANGCGVLRMSLVLLLIAAVPFVVTAYLVLLFASWWVAAPCAALVAEVVFISVVKFKQ